jgi:bifunctional non-homologous end joining protein LigD
LHRCSLAMGMPQSISLPLQPEPQLCTLVPKAPAGDGWIHKIKWDGWRLLARKEGADVRLYTRGGYEWSARLHAIAKAVAELPCRSAWLDGELVYLDGNGVSDFDALSGALRGGGQRLFYQCWDCCISTAGV